MVDIDSREINDSEVSDFLLKESTEDDSQRFQQIVGSDSSKTFDNLLISIGGFSWF